MPRDNVLDSYCIAVNTFLIVILGVLFVKEVMQLAWLIHNELSPIQVECDNFKIYYFKSFSISHTEPLPDPLLIMLLVRSKKMAFLYF